MMTCAREQQRAEYDLHVRCPEAMLKGRMGLLEQLDCSVVETAHCPGTDGYSLQVIC